MFAYISIVFVRVLLSVPLGVQQASFMNSQGDQRHSAREERADTSRHLEE